MDLSYQNKASRHAYAVLAHDDRQNLLTLLELIDDPRNDIFLLIDKKAPRQLEEDLEVKSSRLTILPSKDRIDVRWGGISMVEAELKLYEYIVETQIPYKYIHLISGKDLPIKNQDEIHDFFNATEDGSNFIEISESEENDRDLRFKTDYFHFFTNSQRSVGNGNSSGAALLLKKTIRRLGILLQKLVGYKRNWHDLKLAKGMQWASISLDFAKYIVARKHFILKKFKGVLIPDEIYKQSMILNSPYNSTVKAFSRGNSGGIRLMDWEKGIGTGSPKTWTIEDWEEINSAYELFARKFSSEKDSKIIEKIRDKVLKPTNG